MHCCVAGCNAPWKSCNAPPQCLAIMATKTHILYCRTAWWRWAGGGTLAMQGHAACGQWAFKLLQCTTTLPWAMRSVTRAMYRHSACGQWALKIPQCNAMLHGATLRWNSCNARSHYMRAVGYGTPAMQYHTTGGPCAVELLQCSATVPAVESRNALPQCLEALGSEHPPLHCHMNLRAAVNGTRAMHCHTGHGELALEPLQCTATLLGCSGQYSCIAVPQFPGALGSGTLGMHCRTSCRQ